MSAYIQAKQEWVEKLRRGQDTTEVEMKLFEIEGGILNPFMQADFAAWPREQRQQAASSE